ncbi:MAG: aminoacyl-tRNA hydrolase [Gammaproteobacteria bacterium]|nr:aminoacyl-tRNA hydrolase [Gammaproteobacteria bacterium]
MSSLKLIVGLGNPGPTYQDTRHNVGQWFIQALVQHQKLALHLETKFFSQLARYSYQTSSCWLLTPSTFMNESGKAVTAFVNYYSLLPEEILVVHDELDFPPGVIRVKQGGGAAGHNGLKSILASLHQEKEFWRLRIGIGHPGDKSKVTSYVLHSPSKPEKAEITLALQKAVDLVPQMIQGEWPKVMQVLHSCH